MTEIIDIIPLVQYSLEDIRSRVDADANAGLDSTDENYIDTTVGGFFYSFTQGAVLEADRLWDFLSTEVVAAIFPQSSWGDYLDYHGEMLNVLRKDANAASGSITFTGATGTLVGVGTQVGVITTSPDDEEITFSVTGSGGVALDDQYNWQGPWSSSRTYDVHDAVTAPDGDPFYATTLVVSGGAEPSTNVLWAALPASTSINLPVEADNEGSSSNVAAGAVTLLLSNIEGISEVVNATAMSGGAEAESDEDYRDRLLLEWQSPGPVGTVSWYRRRALAQDGVGYAQVEPLWNGPGTVRVIIADPDRNPVNSGVTSALQALLAPDGANGGGEAPIGANVTVTSITGDTLTVSANVTPAAGYSLLGGAGTIVLTDDIVIALKAYVDSLNPGDDVILSRLESMFFRVPGVFDVTAVEINGSASNHVVASTSVATLDPDSVTLT